MRLRQNVIIFDLLLIFSPSLPPISNGLLSLFLSLSLSLSSSSPFLEKKDEEKGKLHCIEIKENSLRPI